MDVKGFNHCKLYSEGIAYWEDEYPKHGVNFKLWDQFAKKGDTTCTNGIFNEKAQTCFTYKIFSQICLLVKFKKDKETNSYTWVHTGGCYEGGSKVFYRDAKPDDVLNFTNVQFEVRLDNREDADIAFEEEEEPNFGEEIDGNDLEASQTKLITTNQKIKQEKAKLTEQAKNGEIENESSFFFYHMFKFLALITLLLAIVLFGMVGYEVIFKDRQQKYQPVRDLNE